MSREFNVMEDFVEEEVVENDKGVLCKFNHKTQGWEPIEDHCNKCGRKECECEESYSAIFISQQVGGGAIVEESFSASTVIETGGGEGDGIMYEYIKTC